MSNEILIGQSVGSTFENHSYLPLTDFPFFPWKSILRRLPFAANFNMLKHLLIAIDAQYCKEIQIVKCLTEYLWFHTTKQREYINITDRVTEIVDRSGIRDGMVLVSAMHITAGVYVNDAEDGLIQDIDEWLEKLAPFNLKYHHHRTGETNGDAHLKSLLLHHEVIVPLTDGALDFGPWQQIYYAEFDGRRRKRVVVKVMGAEQ